MIDQWKWHPESIGLQVGFSWAILGSPCLGVKTSPNSLVQNHSDFVLALLGEPIIFSHDFIRKTTTSSALEIPLLATFTEMETCKSPERCLTVHCLRSSKYILCLRISLVSICSSLTTFLPFCMMKWGCCR